MRGLRRSLSLWQKIWGVDNAASVLGRFGFGPLRLWVTPTIHA